MSYLVAVKTAFNTIETFKVRREIYLYIKQLETAIKFDATDGIKQLYPGRFIVGKEKKE